MRTRMSGGVRGRGLITPSYSICKSTDYRLSLQGDTVRSIDKLADPDVVKNILILQETGKKREKKYNTIRLCL